MASMGHCSQCGKDFPMLYPHMWRYKTGNKLFCSWHCLRADERKEEDEMSGKLTQKQREEAVEIAIQGGDQIAYLKKECGAPNPWATWAYLKKKLEKENPVKYNRLLQVETLKNAGIDPKSKMPKNFQDIREVVADRFPPNDGSARISWAEAEELAKKELVSDIYRKKPEETTEELEEKAAEVINGEDAGSEKQAEVIKVDRVLPVEIPEQQIQPLGLQGGVNYQLMVDETKIPKIAPGFELEVTAVRHKNYGEFYRDHDHNCIDWRTPGGDEMSLSVDAWKKLIRDLPEIIKQLGVEV